MHKSFCVLVGLAAILFTSRAWAQTPPATLDLEFSGSGNNLAATGFEGVWNDDPTHYSVANGSLTINIQPGDIYGQYGPPCETGATDPDNAKNVFYSSIDVLDRTTVDAKVTVTGLNQNYHGGGILIGTDTDHYFRLGVINNTGAGGIVVEALRENEDLWPGPAGTGCPGGPGNDIVGRSSASLAASPLASPLTVYLRIVRNGTTAQGFYSLNGTDYTQVANFTFDAIVTGSGSAGTVEDPSFKVGAYGFGGDASQKPASISFDYIKAKSETVQLPKVDLTTANSYNWSLAPATKSADGTIPAGASTDLPAYIQPGADPAAFIPNETVPGQWDQTYAAMNPPLPRDMNYGWYRLHLTIPAEMKFPSRGLIYRVRNFNGASYGDTDITWFNGHEIGRGGSLPSVPIVPGDADNGGLANYYQGLAIAGGLDRAYPVPPSIINYDGDNVITALVFNRGGSGGLIGIPSIEVAPPVATVSGTVTSGGQPLAGARVAAMGTDAITTDATFTDASGKFTLGSAGIGPAVLGVTKPGYVATSMSLGTLAEGQVKNGITVALAATSGGLPAPLLDDFTGSGTDWQANWVELNEAPPSTTVATNDPSVVAKAVLPGYNVQDSTAIPGSLTIEVTNQGRAGLMTKNRFNKFASVNSGKLISAFSQGGGPDNPSDEPNVAFQINGNPNDNFANMTFDQGYWVEFNMENYVFLRDPGPAPITQGTRAQRWKVYNQPNGFISQGPVPSGLVQLNDLKPSNPIVMIVARTGSFYDFYLSNSPTGANPVLVLSGNMPIPAMADHRLFLYSADSSQKETWDWVAAGPKVLTPGDFANVTRALSIASGLVAAQSTDMATLNVTNVGDSNNKIDFMDAATLLRQLYGL